MGSERGTAATNTPGVRVLRDSATSEQISRPESTQATVNIKIENILCCENLNCYKTKEDF